ncbi:MAG TPA: hypothetical protein PKI01_12190 [Bacteroidales bacterium]|nr:hypothetical protein [Bacteroidales bacterium]
MITDKKKDSVLKYLCENIPCGVQKHFETKEMLSTTGLDFTDANAIMQYFERIGFIGNINLRLTDAWVLLNVEACDFFSRGGFVAQEELLKKNIEKLLLEIESLKPSVPEKIATLTSIAANITTALSFFIPK